MLPEHVDTAYHGAAAASIGIPGSHRFDITPGRKGTTVAGDNQAADGRIIGRLASDPEHRVEHLRVHRVHRLGPVERHDGDSAAIFEEDGFGHCWGSVVGVVNQTESGGGRSFASLS